MSESTVTEAVQLLKRVPRSGWIYAGVDLADVESVAEHSFGVAFLSMLLAEALRSQGTDVEVAKTLKMALIHDVSESMTWDISKRYLDFLGKKGQRIKQELEESANRRIFSELPPRIRQEAFMLLKEHAVGETVEARIVAAADRLDLLMQLSAYRRGGLTSEILDEMSKKITAEVKGMRNPVFTAMLKRINI